MSSFAPTTHPFTCNTCQVAFRSSDLQRTHMQSDWHHYNLKRRVASLPPLASDVFAEKVLATKAEVAATVAQSSYKKTCEPCRKAYYSQNAFDNHLSSQRHKAKLLRLSQKAGKNGGDAASMMSSTFSLGAPSTQVPDDESIDDEAEEEFKEVVDGLRDTNLNEQDPVSRRPTRPHQSANGEGMPEHPLSATATKSNEEAPNGELSRERAIHTCLFCTYNADDLDDNLDHMTRIHDLFIPERRYLVDMPGLLLHLAHKVSDDYQCLYCGRLKWSEDGIKTHMRDVGHCKIAYETEEAQLDIGEYYDFRSTYSDSYEDSDSEMYDADPAGVDGGVKLGAARATKTRIHGEDDEELPDADVNDEGWETSSDVSSVPTEELGALYADEDDKTKAARANRIRLHRHHSHGDHRRHHATDGWHAHTRTLPQAVYHDDFELHLPSGRVAGHRSLNKYYRQNLHNYPSAAEREERQQRLLTDGIRSDSDTDQQERTENGRGRQRDHQLVTRANGGLGMVAVSEAKKRQVRAMEKKDRQREGRAMAKKQWRTNLKGNQQKHYRDPLLQ